MEKEKGTGGVFELRGVKTMCSLTEEMGDKLGSGRNVSIETLTRDDRTLVKGV